jgi:hypothetical protein
VLALSCDRSLSHLDFWMVLYQDEPLNLYLVGPLDVNDHLAF